LDYLLLLLKTILLLGFIDSVVGKAIPLPFPFPADSPPAPATTPPAPINPDPPKGALPVPGDPVKNLNKNWFLTYLTEDQPDDNCVFYCRISPAARDWVKQHPPLRTIWETYPKFIFVDEEEPRKSFADADEELDATDEDGYPLTPNLNKYAAMSSEAYAERCRGTTVHLLLDEDIGIPEKCIWNSEEKAALKRGSVKKVIEITFEKKTMKEKSRREYLLACDPVPEVDPSKRSVTRLGLDARTTCPPLGP
jgi:hypothetical protein